MSTLEIDDALKILQNVCSENPNDSSCPTASNGSCCDSTVLISALNALLFTKKSLKPFPTTEDQNGIHEVFNNSSTVKQLCLLLRKVFSKETYRNVLLANVSAYFEGLLMALQLYENNSELIVSILQVLNIFVVEFSFGDLFFDVLGSDNGKGTISSIVPRYQINIDVMNEIFSLLIKLSKLKPYPLDFEEALLRLVDAYIAFDVDSPMFLRMGQIIFELLAENDSRTLVLNASGFYENILNKLRIILEMKQVNGDALLSVLSIIRVCTGNDESRSKLQTYSLCIQLIAKACLGLKLDATTPIGNKIVKEWCAIVCDLCVSAESKQSVIATEGFCNSFDMWMYQMGNGGPISIALCNVVITLCKGQKQNTSMLSDTPNMLNTLVLAIRNINLNDRRLNADGLIQILAVLNVFTSGQKNIKLKLAKIKGFSDSIIECLSKYTANQTIVLKVCQLIANITTEKECRMILFQRNLPTLLKLIAQVIETHDAFNSKIAKPSCLAINQLTCGALTDVDVFSTFPNIATVMASLLQNHIDDASDVAETVTEAVGRLSMCGATTTLFRKFPRVDGIVIDVLDKFGATNVKIAKNIGGVIRSLLNSPGASYNVTMLTQYVVTWMKAVHAHAANAEFLLFAMPLLCAMEKLLLGKDHDSSKSLHGFIEMIIKIMQHHKRRSDIMDPTTFALATYAAVNRDFQGLTICIPNLPDLLLEVAQLHSTNENVISAALSVLSVHIETATGFIETSALSADLLMDWLIKYQNKVPLLNNLCSLVVSSSRNPNNRIRFEKETKLLPLMRNLIWNNPRNPTIVQTCTGVIHAVVEKNDELALSFCAVEGTCKFFINLLDSNKGNEKLTPVLAATIFDFINGREVNSARFRAVPRIWSILKSILIKYRQGSIVTGKICGIIANLASAAREGEITEETCVLQEELVTALGIFSVSRQVVTQCLQAILNLSLLDDFGYVFEGYPILWDLIMQALEHLRQYPDVVELALHTCSELSVQPDLVTEFAKKSTRFGEFISLMVEYKANVKIATYGCSTISNLCLEDFDCIEQFLESTNCLPLIVELMEIHQYDEEAMDACTDAFCALTEEEENLSRFSNLNLPATIFQVLTRTKNPTSACDLIQIMSNDNREFRIAFAAIPGSLLRLIEVLKNSRDDEPLLCTILEILLSMCKDTEVIHSVTAVEGIHQTIFDLFPTNAADFKRAEMVSHLMMLLDVKKLQPRLPLNDIALVPYCLGFIRQALNPSPLTLAIDDIHQTIEKFTYMLQFLTGYCISFDRLASTDMKYDVLEVLTGVIRINGFHSDFGLNECIPTIDNICRFIDRVLPNRNNVLVELMNVVLNDIQISDGTQDNAFLFYNIEYCVGKIYPMISSIPLATALRHFEICAMMLFPAEDVHFDFLTTSLVKIGMTIQPLSQCLKIPNICKSLIYSVERMHKVNDTEMDYMLCCVIRDVTDNLMNEGWEEVVNSFRPHVSNIMVKLPLHAMINCLDGPSQIIPIFGCFINLWLIEPQSELIASKGTQWIEQVMLRIAANADSFTCVAEGCRMLLCMLDQDCVKLNSSVMPLTRTPLHSQIMESIIEHVHIFINSLDRYMNTSMDLVYWVCKLLCVVIKNGIKNRSMIIVNTSNVEIFHRILVIHEGHSNITTLVNMLLYPEGRVQQKKQETAAPANSFVSSSFSIPTVMFSADVVTSYQIPGIEINSFSLLDVNVFQGTWRRSPVALKILRAKPSVAEAQLQQEAALLTSLRHPRIISLYGCSLDVSIQEERISSKYCALVMELMEKGSLRSMLRREYTAMSWMSKLTIAVDICEGMRFLHDCMFIHGDLNSDNVLIDNQGRAKLTGLKGKNGIEVSTDAPQSSKKNEKKKNNISTKTPSNVNHTSEIDILMFAVILWELITGKEPPNKGNGTNNGAKVNNKQCSKLQLTSQEIQLAPPMLVTLFHRCQSNDAATRPIFTTLYDDLHAQLSHEMKRQNEAKHSIPDGYLCPITQDIMTDPVMLLDGHSYERKAIVDWLKRSDRSPLTNAVLPSTTVLDNFALKSAIENFRLSHPGIR